MWYIRRGGPRRKLCASITWILRFLLLMIRLRALSFNATGYLIRRRWIIPLTAGRIKKNLFGSDRTGAPQNAEKTLKLCDGKGKIKKLTFNYDKP